MKIYKWGRMSGLFILLFAAIFENGIIPNKAQAKEEGQILKELLEQDGDAEIEIKKDIILKETIHVRGRKRLIGNGHCIYRSKAANKFYGGTLFCVEEGKFYLRDTVVSGVGVKKVNKRVYGRLVEVKNGTFVLEKGSVLKKNSNVARGEEGGGAVIVRKSGSFIMQGGTITDNEIVTEGAAVKVEKQGTFIMKGGVIKENKSRGIGAVEGFDGRGGAIYNEGTVKIKKGQLLNNHAVSYSDSEAIYGGAGGVIYNRGRLFITGGTIKANGATHGGAIYNDENSIVHIKKAIFINNQAERGRTVFLSGGSCILEVFIDTNKEIRKEKGAKLVLKYSDRKSKPEDKDKLENTKKKKDSIHLEGSLNEKIYYLGEKIGKEEILSGISVYHGKKEITDKVEILNLKGGKLATSKCWRGRLQICLREKKGEYNRYIWEMPFKVVKNHVPVVKVAHRYLFTWEIKKRNEYRLRKLLLEGLKISDCEDNPEDLWEHAQIDWGNVRDGKAGDYRVYVKIKDQWGHRFYMSDGETKRYGNGNVAEFCIPVTLVDGETGTDNTGKVRFVPVSAKTDSIQEEWHFSKEDVKNIKAYMKMVDNPFSEKTNDGFLQKFEANRIPN